MKTEIINILDRGIANKERLLMRVLADCDLSYFIVFATKYTSINSITNFQKHAHWFTPKKVKSGDYIVLYSCAGNSSETKNNDGSTTYFLFWGISNTIWSNLEDCAVLFELSSWQTSKYEPFRII